jgi:hypothetical protein
LSSDCEKFVKVAVIFHRFGPYHYARREATARHCETIGIEVAAETLEYAWSPVQSAGNYSRLTLFPNAEREPAKTVFRRMEDALRTSHLDAVAILGWSGKSAIAALRWCAESGTPAILMSESAALDQPRMRWREWIKQRIALVFIPARLLAVSATLITWWRWECLATGSSPDTMWWTMSISAERRKRSEVRGQRSDRSMGCRQLLSCFGAIY